MSDFETHLRQLLAAESDAPQTLVMWENAEKRMQVRVAEREFVVFGNNAVPAEGIKPPTQTAGVHGFSAFGAMGGK